MVKSLLVDEPKYMNYRCKVQTEYARGELVDVYFQTKLDPGYRSMRPIHDVCIHTETTRLSQALHALRSLGVPKQDICTF